MNCRQVRKWLQPFADGALERRKAAAIEAHLAGCAACREEAALLRTLDAALSAEPTVDPPADMAPAIVNRALARRLAIRRLMVPRWLEALTFAGVALGLAAAAFVVLGATGALAAPHGLTPMAWSVLALTVGGGLAAFGWLYYSAEA